VHFLADLAHFLQLCLWCLAHFLQVGELHLLQVPEVQLPLAQLPFSEQVLPELHDLYFVGASLGHAAAVIAITKKTNMKILTAFTKVFCIVFFLLFPYFIWFEKTRNQKFF
jgi:hypothetical protein